MLWLARALSHATDARDPALEGAIRANLANWGRLVSPLRGITSVPDEVNRIAVSPDGKCFATANFMVGAVRIWDAASGALRAQLHHPQISNAAKMWEVKTLPSLVFSPDSKALLTALDGSKGGDPTVWFWDAATGKALGDPLKHDGPVNIVAFSADGNTLLTAGGKAAYLWDARSRKPLGKPLIHGAKVQAAAINRDGMLVLTGGQDKIARLWDRSLDGGVRREFRHESEVTHALISADGKFIVTAERVMKSLNAFDWKGKAHIWDVATGKRMAL
jgi:WD40 repeat protein